jgi:hypothetical protein
MTAAAPIKAAKATAPKATAAKKTPARKPPQPSGQVALAAPVNFGEQILGVQFYDWQKEVMGWFAKTDARMKASVAAPNGSGKSERVIAALALWWVCMSPRASVVITSKDSRQLDQQIWPALEQHKVKFSKMIWNSRYIETPTGGRIIGFTTDDPGRAEGWHRQPDGPLLLIADEAKSIPEAIFEAFDRCTYNGLLYISSTGLMQGRFYESHTSKADQFKTRRVRLEECPHIPEARINDILNTYGEEHPFTRSTLYSEFMSRDEESMFFFTLSSLDKCLSSPPAVRGGERVAFCDFAGGGDENVLAIREGNMTRIVRAWRESNEMAAIGEFIREFKALGLDPSEIYGDNGGAGKPMIARFHEVGWPINRYNAGENAIRDDDYANRSAEVWDTAAREVAKGSIILPDDPALKAQLVARKRLVDSRGRLKAESKEDMRKRGVKSPDRADAITAVIALRQPAILRNREANPPWMEFISDSFSQDLEHGGALTGASAGD